MEAVLWRVAQQPLVDVALSDTAAGIVRVGATVPRDFAFDAPAGFSGALLRERKSSPIVERRAGAPTDGHFGVAGTRR